MDIISAGRRYCIPKLKRCENRSPQVVLNFVACSAYLGPVVYSQWGAIHQVGKKYR